MSRRLIVRPQAEADLLEIVRWYEEKQAGLGWQFAEEAGQALKRALGNPRAYRLMRRQPQVRRILVRRFPYESSMCCAMTLWWYLRSFMENGRKRPGLIAFEFQFLHGRPTVRVDSSLA